MQIIILYKHNKKDAFSADRTFINSFIYFSYISQETYHIYNFVLITFVCSEYSHLEKVMPPSSVTYIEDNAFYNCTNLKFFQKRHD